MRGDRKAVTGARPSRGDRGSQQCPATRCGDPTAVRDGEHLLGLRHPLISALAGLGDTALTQLLLRSGFLGTRLMRGSGTRADVRIHFQYKSRVAYVDPDSRHLVPIGDHEQLNESLGPSDHAVTALVPLGDSLAFEIARFEQDDPATLQSGEAAAGIAFSGSVLAAITFLLGFAFSSTRFPDDVRLLLIGATFSTVLSLIVYASASGELARIRSNAFGKIMKWGTSCRSTAVYSRSSSHSP